ncbi:NAD(P)-binding protein [Gonapodya prolifera JEL478]|uniref:NAD(P)-binding protein n=1 Tax=Gonapodya prolifera (strain JEL478) TaxID=1344416 RepID=A0A139AAP8_GONPJ|nr:NAD(P)-binding protein [Gonapodya prolifera JEL478]|eukprot:KXS13901.1 NAD(P)-binding protein [Gonapodya prolifera JEL478]
MMSQEQEKRKILITGATGKQGGAALTAMHRDLSDRYTFRALTRNPDSEKSKSLIAKGVEVAKGDLMDKESLERAMTGVWGLYLVTDPFTNGGAKKESEMGINAVDVAFNAGVSYIVFASGGGIDNTAMRVPFPFYASKEAIQDHISSLAWPVGWATIGPTGFMENFEMSGPMSKGSISSLAKPDQKMYWISAKDIGEFVSLAFAKVDEFKGRKVDIAGDELSNNDCAAILSELTGVKWTYWRIPTFILRFISADLFQMGQAFDGYVPTEVDIAALRSLHPGLQSFRDWCKEKGIGKPGDPGTTYVYAKTFWQRIFV